MMDCDKLNELRGMVDQVRYRDRLQDGIYHVELQAGYPPSPFPRWIGQHRDIKQAYDKPLRDALDYWGSNEGYTISA